MAGQKEKQRAKRYPPFKILGCEIPAGSRRTLEMEVATLFDFTPLRVPIQVVHGRGEGPVLFVSAAIHGDEINGTEIIQRLLKSRSISSLKGTLIAIPVVNVFGFNQRMRTLPDGRDLNRSFPGSATGSMAARLAHGFMNEIVKISTHGIDLHTGARHRTNLPQVRGSLDDVQTMDLAKAFGVPVIVHSGLIEGSLRKAVVDEGVPVLLYEAGEALRHDEIAIRTGVRGILSVMKSLGMIKRGAMKRTKEAYVANKFQWVRAPQSGILHIKRRIGQFVSATENLGSILNPMGTQSYSVVSPKNGIIIGQTMLPLVNEGDALFNLATFEDPEAAEKSAEFIEELWDYDHLNPS